MITITETSTLSYFDYDPIADSIIKNWAKIGTVRIFKNKVFIQHVSTHFFIELLRRKTKVKLIYRLTHNHKIKSKN